MAKIVKKQRKATKRKAPVSELLKAVIPSTARIIGYNVCVGGNRASDRLFDIVRTA